MSARHPFAAHGGDTATCTACGGEAVDGSADRSRQVAVAITQTVVPARILDGKAAAAYLGVSYWTLQSWHAAGRIPALDLPPLHPREGDRPKDRLRVLRFDRADLDRFIDALPRI